MLLVRKCVTTMRVPSGVNAATKGREPTLGSSVPSIRPGLGTRRVVSAFSTSMIEIVLSGLSERQVFARGTATHCRRGSWKCRSRPSGGMRAISAPGSRPTPLAADHAHVVGAAVGGEQRAPPSGLKVMPLVPAKQPIFGFGRGVRYR